MTPETVDKPPMKTDDEEVIERVLELDAKATDGPWDCKPDPERENDSIENWRYEDENSGSMTSAVRPFGASVEDTIAECWGTEHDDQANAALISTYRTAAPNLARRLRKRNARIAVLEKQLSEAKAVNERDRSAVAEGVSGIRKAITAREWLRLGRGSYEWNDDRWMDEFGKALDEIVAATRPLLKIACDREHCPTTQAEIEAARKGDHRD